MFALVTQWPCLALEYVKVRVGEGERGRREQFEDVACGQSELGVISTNDTREGPREGGMENEVNV